MLSLYQDDIDNSLSLLDVTFFGENALDLDLDNVKREAFSLFWDGAINALFDGSNTFVSRISPEKNVYFTGNQSWVCLNWSDSSDHQQSFPSLCCAWKK